MSSSRTIAALGFPMLLGALSASLSGVIDTAMMGRFGPADLAAVAGTSAVFDIFANVVLAAMVSYQILAPRFAGRKDPAGIRRSLASALRWCGGAAILLTVVTYAAGGWLSGLVSGGDEQVRQIGADYLATRAPTLLLIVPFTLLTASLNAYGETRYAALASIVVNAANLGLDAALIYGPGPFPRLGAAGNGLATTLAWLIGLACLAVSARRFGLWRRLGASGPALPPPDFETSVPRLAWPAVVSNGLDYAGMAVFFAILGSVGTTALAGGRVAFEITLFLFGIGMSFGAAARILIGRSAGAEDPAAVRGLWSAGRGVLLVPAVLIALLLVVFAHPVAGIFTSFADVREQTVTVLPLVALCVPLMALTLGNLSLIRALGHTRKDMYANLAAALLVQLPVGWLGATATGWGLRGAFLGVLAYWLARAVFTEIVARRLLPVPSEPTPLQAKETVR
ncbi:MATE family efflux transporter [Actinoplanes sp. RD1]|uniref:MATE family efflux transporter n=1 Tax=Actinoplanes sp. RD1 TaxID=3064538 RepID=UPI002741C4B5|nr:MATE family efflux transporter [Actinoplanes sp. RD1]